MTLAEDMDEEAAVDYAIAADSAVHRVHRLEVIRVDGRSDHSLLCLAVSIRVNASAHLHRTRALRPLPRHRRSPSLAHRSRYWSAYRPLYP